MKSKEKGRFALWLLLSLIFASQLNGQPTPVIHWTFNNLSAPWHDHSTDEVSQNLTFPSPGHTFWNVGNWILTDPWNGGYLHEVYTPGVANPTDIRCTGAVNTTYNTFPFTCNPDGLSMGMGFRMRYPTCNLTVFDIYGRIKLKILNGVFNLTVFYEPGNVQYFNKTLNGTDISDMRYLYDGNWHHLGMIYEWCETSHTGTLSFIIDGFEDPAFTFDLTNRLPYQEMVGIYFFPAAGGPVDMDIDEVIFYDETIQNNDMKTLAMEFLQHGKYCFGCTTTAASPLPSYSWAYNNNDFVTGYSPASPPSTYTSTTLGLTPILSQFESYPLPRYSTTQSMPRNHIYPGLMLHLANTTTSPETQVSDLFEELYFNWNHSFNLGSVNATGGSVDSYQSTLAATAAGNSSISDLSITSNWISLKAYNYPSTSTWTPNISRTDLGTTLDDYYMENTATSGNSIRFFHSVGNLIDTDCIAPGSIALDAPTAPATLDGNFVESQLALLEGSSYANKPINFIMENGEGVGPYSFSYTLYPKLTTNVNWFSSACASPTSGTYAANETGVTSDYLGSYGTTQNATTWKQYYSDRISGFREAYRDAIFNGSTSKNFWHYWNSGASNLNYEQSSSINLTQGIGSSSSQTHYAAPYMYPQRPLYWFSGMTSYFGFSQLISASQEQNAITTPQPYFAPAVCAGYDDGNTQLVRERDMLRPAQYLGLLKGAAMLGAEYFVSFIYMQGNINIHHSSAWGWQMSTPSYAQSIISRSGGLYYNSDLMAGNYGSHFTTNTFGTGGTNRFWAGADNNLVVAREGTGSYTDQYLITGTIQNRYNANLSPTGYTYGSEAAENISADILGSSGDPLQFEIRKQGSTYIFDNSNSSDPVFYQLDKWHEYAHPDKWTEDFYFEAEVYDNNVGTGGYDFQIKTEGKDHQPITDLDFRNFTSFVNFEDQLTSWTYQSSGNPYLSYNFTPRSTNTYNCWVRVRNPGYAAGLTGRITATIMQGTTTVATLPSGFLSSDCWEWVNLGSFTASTANAVHEVILSPENPFIDIDQVVLQVSGGAGFSSTSAVSITSISPSTTTSTCANAEEEITFTYSGSLPAWLKWNDGGADQYFEIPTVGACTLTVYPTSSTATITLVSISDGNCITSIGTTVNYTVSTPTQATISASDPYICGTSSVTLTPSAGSAYSWSDGSTGSTLVTSTPGVYYVTVTDNSTSCPSIAGYQLTRFTPRISTPSSIICGSTSFTLTAVPGITGTFTYNWSNSGGTSSTATYSLSGTPETYYCTVTDVGSSCAEVASITIYPEIPDIIPIGPLYTNSSNVTLSARPTGGSWEISSNGGSSWTALSGGIVAPATLGAGNYDVRYTPGSGCTTTATSSFSILNTCSGATCGIVSQETLFEDNFSSCEECDQGSSPTWTGLTQECTIGSFGAGEFAYTDAYSTIGDHTYRDGSNYLVALTSGSSDAIYSFEVDTEIGRDYLLRFWQQTTSSYSFSGSYQINSNTPVNFTASQGSWDLVCENFQATSTTATVTITIPASSLLAIDDVSIDRVSPSVTISGPTERQYTQSLTLTTSAVSGPATYQWYEWISSSWTAISGATASSFTRNPVNCNGGGSAPCVNQYKVEVTQGTCVASDEHSVQIWSYYPKTGPDGQPEPAQATSIMVFPNPNTGQFTLNLDLPQETDVQFALYDLLGRQVLRGEIPNASGNLQRTLDISSQSQGVYLLKVKAGEIAKTIRVVRE